MTTILVVDDDPHILEVVTFALERAGHRTVQAQNGEDALTLAQTAGPDLVVLDVGLPGRDGLEVCRTLRAEARFADLPILFLSARDEEIDRVLGLEMGADDYVTKPFSPRELTARVAAILRRRSPSTEPAKGVLAHGAVALDLDRAMVSCAGTPVTLTAQEIAFLRVLLARPGFVFDRTRIIELAYEGVATVSDRTVDSHVRNLRAKLAAAGCRDAIETVPRLGFRLGPCSAGSGVTGRQS
ncbi:MAG: two-component system response regulator CreB [Hyphomicrobiales bacterium]|nr:MAG: two-component system response regulator CreB [Hyphomicrobiales bacterium]